VLVQYVGVRLFFEIGCGGGMADARTPVVSILPKYRLCILPDFSVFLASSLRIG
jgi:hypothetical protein